MTKERFKITPASYLVLIRGGKVLLQLRQNTGYRDGEYTVASGHVEKGESFVDALIREIKEEINIELEPKYLHVAHIMHRLGDPDKSASESRRQRIDIFFTTDKWSGKIKNGELDKCVHIKWFPLDALPKNIFPYVKFVLEQISKGIIFSEYGFE